MFHSLYIHFPFCFNLCEYCDFFKQAWQKEAVDELGNVLETQYQELGRLFHYPQTHVELETLYLGGGTPWTWGEAGRAFLAKFVKERIRWRPHYEWTIELNPEGFSEEDYLAWTSIGVNRFSVGVQAWDDLLVQGLGRRQRLQEVEVVLGYLKQQQANFSVDLMMGIPGEESRQILTEIDNILEFNPKHISLYILEFKNGRVPKRYKKLPEDELIRENYLLCSAYLQRQGFEHYEVSNFAKNGYRSQHNLSYWQGKSVAALGPGATGFHHVQPGIEAIRYKWGAETSLEQERLDRSALCLEKVYLGLRTQEGIELALFSERDQIQVLSIAQRWQQGGYGHLSNAGGRLMLTPLGFLMIDSLMGDLFRELQDF